METLQQPVASSSAAAAAVAAATAATSSMSTLSTASASGTNSPAPGTSTSGTGQLSSSVQPKVLLIATHRNALHSEPLTRDQITGEYFDRIKSSLSSHNYYHLLYPKCFAVDTTDMSVDEPEILSNVRSAFDGLLAGNRDLPWYYIQFETILDRLVRKGVYFADINAIFELTRVYLPDIKSTETLQVSISSSI